MSIQANFPNIAPTLNLSFALTKQLDPRITFTRASEGRYYDGKTFAKAEENLLLQSQAFDNASWSKTTATVTANTEAAPDGTTTADTFAATSGNAILTQSLAAVIGLDYTFSVWIKRKTGTGTVDIACQSALGYQTVAVDSTWQRFTLTRTLTSATPVVAIRLQTSGDEVYVWGAQVEQRSSVTAYTATTTQPITNYIPVLMTAASGVARFDHNPTTGVSLGLLIEEQRTNLQIYSSEFDNAAWTKSNATITANTIVAPDGTLTGDKLVEDTATGEHAIGDGFSFTSGTTYTGTIYAKKAERTLCRVGAGSTATWPASIIVDLSNGTITSTVSGSGTVTDVGNGWYRISVTGTAAATASTNFAVRLVSTGTTISYTGDGYSGLFIWGAQLEAGAFPTSYIPTVAAQVTRSADSASMTGTNFSSWWRPDEGTFYGEASRFGTNAGGVLRAVQFANTAERIALRDSGGAQFLISNSTGIQASVSITGASFGNQALNRLAGAYKVNDVAAAGNGGTVNTDTAAVMPNGVDFLQIGQDGAAATTMLNGHIRKIAFYPARVTNANLQALTS